MKKLTVIITGGKDQFGAWIEEMEGVYAAGDTLDDVKTNICEALTLFIEENELPKEDYEFEFTFDINGFIRYSSGFFGFNGMESITGVSKKRLWDLANSDIKPRKRKEITEKMLKFAEEYSKTKVKL